MNRYDNDGGTTTSVGVYLLPSAELAQIVLDGLRSSATAAAPVEEFEWALLGDEAWIARFEFAQLTLTRVGPFLVGGHSDETFGHDRAGNTQLLIERMGMIVVSAQTYIDSDEIAEPAEPGAAPGGPPDTGADDSGSDGVPVRAFAAIAAAAVAVAAGGIAIRGRTSGRGPRDTGQPEVEEDEEDEEKDKSVLL